MPIPFAAATAFVAGVIVCLAGTSSLSQYSLTVIADPDDVDGDFPLADVPTPVREEPLPMPDPEFVASPVFVDGKPCPISDRVMQLIRREQEIHVQALEDSKRFIVHRWVRRAFSWLAYLIGAFYRGVDWRTPTGVRRFTGLSIVAGLVGMSVLAFRFGCAICMSTFGLIFRAIGCCGCGHPQAQPSRWRTVAKAFATSEGLWVTNIFAAVCFVLCYLLGTFIPHPVEEQSNFWHILGAATDVFGTIQSLMGWEWLRSHLKLSTLAGCMGVVTFVWNWGSWLSRKLCGCGCGRCRVHQTEQTERKEPRAAGAPTAPPAAADPVPSEPPAAMHALPAPPVIILGDKSPPPLPRCDSATRERNAQSAGLKQWLPEKFGPTEYKHDDEFSPIADEPVSSSEGVIVGRSRSFVAKVNKFARASKALIRNQSFALFMGKLAQQRQLSYRREDEAREDPARRALWQMGKVLEPAQPGKKDA